MNDKPVNLTPSYFAPKKYEKPMFNDWPTWKEKCEECGISLSKPGLCGECLELGKLSAKLGRDEDDAVERWMEENEED